MVFVIKYHSDGREFTAEFDDPIQANKYTEELDEMGIKWEFVMPYIGGIR